MYLLTVKDGLVTRFFGPYSTPKEASDDLERVFSQCSERGNWKIHALEKPSKGKFLGALKESDRSLSAA